jgi:hypothetical protein
MDNHTVRQNPIKQRTDPSIGIAAGVLAHSYHNGGNAAVRLIVT